MRGWTGASTCGRIVRRAPGSIPSSSRRSAVVRRPLRAGRAALRVVSGHRRAPIPAGVRVLRIEPGLALGAWRETAVWERQRIGAWIRRGQMDAARALEAVKSFQITN